MLNSRFLFTRNSPVAPDKNDQYEGKILWENLHLKLNFILDPLFRVNRFIIPCLCDLKYICINHADYPRYAMGFIQMLPNY